MSTINAANTENPFVGLRPFDMHEGLLFFGRQAQTVELLQRLHEHHFVGIVGSSGCGKSSLIRAGLIPSLKAGYLVNERDKWMIAAFKPGEGPLYNFATAILHELQKDSSHDAVEAYVQKIQENGADAIIELLEPVYVENNTNIFILVDQFEELFRFSVETNSAAKKDEAIDFVNILLKLFDNSTIPVYVVITMRSDFIGDCTRFFGLPEALNKSQYLVPRPTREQLKNAIEGPVRLYGGKINPALTAKLLNDVQTVKDELPLLQHCLMRTWDYEMKTDRNGELDLEDYSETGGIEKALSQHADEAMAGLNEAEKHIAELVFKALTTTDQGGRKIRRPARLSELTGLTGSDAATINKIIDHFNADKRCFLVTDKSGDANNPLIDISHESLIRQWDTLVRWVDQETESAKIYLRLSDAALLYKKKEKDLISGTELQVAVTWQKKQILNATWAARYNKSYHEVVDFLETSKAQAEMEKQRKEEELKQKIEDENQKRNLKRKNKIVVTIATVIGLLFIISAYLAYYAFHQTRKANMERSKVEKQRDLVLVTLDSLNHAIVQNITDTTEQVKLVRITEQLQTDITKSSNQNLSSQKQAYSIDVFYLQDPTNSRLSDEAYRQAQKLVAVLRKQYPDNVISLKNLSAKTNKGNAGFRIEQNLIQCENNEMGFATEVLSVIKANNVFPKEQPVIQKVYYPTANYISIFVRNM